MEKMEKICRVIIVMTIFCALLISCGSNNFYTQVRKNRKFAMKIYNNYLDSYGNASMIDPEGNFSVVWYYANNKIYITDITRSKIITKKEYDCNTPLNIDRYEKNCYPNVLDGEGFLASYYNTETDSIHKIWIGLDIDRLKAEGCDCEFLKELRNHIIKYKLWETQ